MPQYQVAHLPEQDLIIIPVGRKFETFSADEKHDFIIDLEDHARSAGMSGRVVPVWKLDEFRIGFEAPEDLRDYFKKLDMQKVSMKINKTLHW